MQRTVRWFGPLLVILMAACGTGEPDNEITAIKKARQILITTTGTNVPFSYLGGSGEQGFDVDLGNAIAEKLGVKSRWVKNSFDKHFDLVAENKYDLAIANITINEERKKRVAFSDPYFTSGQILATRREDKSIKSVDDLAGKKVGVHAATTSEGFARAHGAASRAEIQVFDSVDAALLSLNSGSIDAVIGDLPVVVSSIRTGFPHVHTVGEPLTVEPYGVVVRLGETALLKVVNDTLAELKQSGKYDQMVKKWFGDSPELMRYIKRQAG